MLVEIGVCMTICQISLSTKKVNLILKWKKVTLNCINFTQIHLIYEAIYEFCQFSTLAIFNLIHQNY